MNNNYILHQGDTREIINQMIINNEFVDMIFTSPPYYNNRKNYSGNADGEIGSISADEYADWFLTFTEKFLQVLKINGSFFLNINDKIHNGVVHPVIDELKYKMRKQGWFLVAKPYIWFKKSAMPHNCKYRTIDRYEYIFHFSNSNKPNFYAGNCRVPHSKVSIKRYETPVTTMDSRDGKYNKSKKTLHKDGGFPHNVIIANLESNSSILHPAPFPVELVEWFIKIGSLENDIVLDPFCGSSSTGIASLKHNRKYIGIDIIDFNVDFSKKRLDHFLKTKETYIPKNMFNEYNIDDKFYKQKGKHLLNL